MWLKGDYDTFAINFLRLIFQSLDDIGMTQMNPVEGANRNYRVFEGWQIVQSVINFHTYAFNRSSLSNSTKIIKDLIKSGIEFI